MTWRECNDYVSVRIPSQTVFKDVSKLAVSVGNVPECLLSFHELYVLLHVLFQDLLLVLQGVDHVSKGRETLVYELCFFNPVECLFTF